MWKKRGNKYGRKKVEHAGYSFDSKLEAALFDQLRLRERAGQISNVQHHPGTVFLSPARVQYRPDFKYLNHATGAVEYAESKGVRGPKWPSIEKLWKIFGPGRLEVWGGSYNRLKLLKAIQPSGSACPTCGKEIA